MPDPNDPMTVIKRHQKPIDICEHTLFHAISDMSELLGSITVSRGAEREIVITWTDNEDEIVAQLSYYGVYLGNLPKRESYALAGMCYLHAIPIFTEDDLSEMLDQELPTPSTTIN